MPLVSENRVTQSDAMVFLRTLLHVGIIAILTVLTQIGGLAWLVALAFRRTVLAFLILYASLSAATVFVAPTLGRVPLDCASQGPLAMQSFFYCVLNRHYVTPELAQALTDVAVEMDRRYPGTVTLVLDANFPFLDGFPLLPHLSHDDGEKVDLAFYYADDRGYLPGATRSPIGYFAFEDGPTTCTPTFPSLRWDLAPLQSLWADYVPDPRRNRALLNLLANDPRIGRIFVEPHLIDTWNAAHPNIGFQGCRAARHDDHIHLQLR